MIARGLRSGGRAALPLIQREAAPATRPWKLGARWLVAAPSEPYHQAKEPVEAADMVSVSFVDPNTGSVVHAKARCGESLVDVAKANDVDVLAACGQKLQCATCHVIMEQQHYSKLPPAGVREQDLLETTYTCSATSRLGCQVRLTPELDGLVLTLPDASAKGLTRMSLEQPREQVDRQWTSVPASVPSLRRRAKPEEAIAGRINGSQPGASGLAGEVATAAAIAELHAVKQELESQKRLSAHLESELRQLRAKHTEGSSSTSSCSSSGSCSSSSDSKRPGSSTASSSSSSQSSRRSAGSKEAVTDRGESAGSGEEEAEIDKAKAQLQRTRVDSEKLVGRVSFEDIIGLEQAKQAMKEALLWPVLADPSLFSGVRSQLRGMLLYGPPGCGKTMLARAAAAELGGHASFFHVQPGDIMSKFYGDSQIRVLALQELVREAAPAVVFLDEVDSLLTSRDATGVAEHHRATTNALLAWMDGFAAEEKDEQVFFLGATNRPEAIDEAALRRFGGAAEVAAPSKEARLGLLRHLTSKAASQGHTVMISAEELDELSRRTEGFSLADVERLVRNSFLEVVRQLSPSGIQPGLKPSDVPPVMMRHFEATLSGSGSMGTSDLLRLLEKQASEKKRSLAAQRDA